MKDMYASGEGKVVKGKSVGFRIDDQLVGGRRWEGK